MHYPVKISQKDNLFYAEYPDLNCVGIGTNAEKAIKNANKQKDKRINSISQ